MLRAVVLVLKFADDLLDGVLDGDQSGDAAVFVDDDRHMLPGLLHGVEQVIHRLRLGNQHRLPDDGGDIALLTGTREKPDREHRRSMSASVAVRSMQIMSVRGTMISRVSVSDNVSTLRSISETSGSKSLASTRRSMVARPCSS